MRKTLRLFIDGKKLDKIIAKNGQRKWVLFVDEYFFPIAGVLAILLLKYSLLRFAVTSAVLYALHKSK